METMEMGLDIVKNASFPILLFLKKCKSKRKYNPLKHWKLLRN